MKFDIEENIKTKEIKIIIDEPFFDKMPQDIDGVAYPESSEIFVKEPKGGVIIHEIIHVLEDDPETFKAIEEIFSEFYCTSVEDILENIDGEEVFTNYDPKDWVSETYAYFLESALLKDFDNDSKQAIDFLLWTVEDITGICVFLVFETITIDVLKIID